MACFWLKNHETKLHIPTTEDVNAVTYYKITIEVANVKWSVSHRYSEFYDLHTMLINDHGVSKDILPPKKVIRNKCPIFIESRRVALEGYLQNILIYLKRTMPRVFLEFLHFHLYDIFFLLQNMAAYFFTEAVNILSYNNTYTFDPLQLHSISEGFKNPFPEIEQCEKKYDLCHVLDFCTQLKRIVIQGLASNYLASNIIPNSLPIEFSSFKSLEMIEIRQFGMENVYSLGNLRNTIKYLSAYKTNAKNIAQILLSDILHKSSLENNQVWINLKELDLSNNEITEIDETIKLVPNLETLILNENKITNIPSMSSLTKLKHLHMSSNLILRCDQLHTKLGNILTLNLSQNFISTLSGFSKLYSLENLDLSCNKIMNIDSINTIGELPCLENLILTGNAVATMIDYRIKVLEFFGERAKNICLDNEKPSQPELDKVAILRALTIVKEGRTPDFNNISFNF